VYVPEEDTLYPMETVAGTGFFEAVFLDRQEPFHYQLETIDDSGQRTRFHDVYSFWPVLTEDDLYLFGEGRHYKNL
jgi:1,4-alpha-glucan branching enzyme